MRFTAAAATAALLAADGVLGLRIFVSPTVLGDLSDATGLTDTVRDSGIAGVDQLCRVSAKDARFVGLTSSPDTHFDFDGFSFTSALRPNRIVVHARNRVLAAVGDFPITSSFNFPAGMPPGARQFATSFNAMFVPATPISVNQNALAFFGSASYADPVATSGGAIQIWAGSSTNGLSATPSELSSCNAWTTNLQDFRGGYGSVDAVDSQWLNSGNQVCNSNKSFYCIEQNQYGCLFVTNDAVTMAGAKSAADAAFSPSTFTGQAALDAFCSHVAGKAVGDFVALTTTGALANTIYSQFVGNEGSYLLSNLNNQVVSTLRQDLVFRGTLQSRFITNEHGSLVASPYPVWTGVSGTLEDATSAAVQNCNGWTDSTNSFSAFTGDAGDQTDTFVTGNLRSCDQPAHLYCMSTAPLSTCNGFVVGDPHFRGFDGSKYNFDGQDGEIFAIISDAGFQLNSEFTRMNVRGVDGTWMTKIGVRAGKDTVIINPSFEGVLLNGEVTKAFENENVKVTSLSGSVKIEALAAGYSVTVKPVKFFDTTGVTKAFLDVQVGITQRPMNPHGLLGQTARFLADGSAPAPVVSTGLNGEGVIEGIWTDYIVHDGLVGTDFNFAAFDNVVAAKQARSVIEPVTAAFSQ